MSTYAVKFIRKMRRKTFLYILFAAKYSSLLFITLLCRAKLLTFVFLLIISKKFSQLQGGAIVKKELLLR